MASDLNFTLASRNVTFADRDFHHDQVPGPGHFHQEGHEELEFLKNNYTPKTTLSSSCFALSEQDDLKWFLGESILVDDYVCLSPGCDVLDPLSSGLVGSLSAGSAGTVETQFALSNWESTHQTSRGQYHLFDYDQICDLSRGLCHPIASAPKASYSPGYQIGHIPQWENLRRDFPWLNCSLEQIPQGQEPENLILQSTGSVAAPPVTPQTIHNNGEAYSLQEYSQCTDQPLDLHTNNSLECLKSCSTLNDQDEIGAGVLISQSPSYPNSGFGSFDGFLESLALKDNSQFPFMRSPLPSSSGSSPEAGLTTTTMKQHSICPSKQRRHMHRAGPEKCQYCGATFSRPSEFKRHTSKHILPHKCPHQGCTCAFAQRKDLERHLSTRKHWQNENHPLQRVSCHVKGCRFATEGFTRKDNLLRHVRKVHGELGQGNDKDRKAHGS